jgi:hypothetical protein
VLAADSDAKAFQSILHIFGLPAAEEFVINSNVMCTGLIVHEQSLQKSIRTPEEVSLS